ncbi:MAG: hypothetical protein ACI9F9_000873 [Candidatus Paceibacteria bacterium]
MVRRYNTDTPKERRGPAPLGDVLRHFLKDSGLGAQLRHARVYGAWSDALGERLRERAKPVHFQFGELTVEVESAPHMHELQNFTGEQYRQGANKALGEDVIKKVLFRLKR